MALNLKRIQEHQKEKITPNPSEAGKFPERPVWVFFSASYLQVCYTISIANGLETGFANESILK